MVAESYQGTVLITGASTGIGQACALLLDKLGFTVFAGVRQDIDAQALQEKASPRLIPVFLDVTDADSIASVAQKVTNTVGDAGILGLVNNAGIAVPGPLELLPIAEFQHQMNVNVTGQLAVTQAFLGLLRQGSGRIVNMGSIAGRSPTPFLGAYNASKFALEALTDVMRMELKPWGISVSIIEPGSIATPIWNKSLTQADIGQNSLPESALNLYGRAMNIVRHKMQMIASRGISADIVAQAVVHALTAKQPKTRYLIGQDAKIQAVLKHILPDRLYDRLILYSMGL
ncbi:retinol dehydrogenase [Nostoc linckia z18]|jgi:NAD(P)-dependent dehydrogenase (short-subunit alcohol dehydrogenase family)|uniref:Retinol dehydrogenase n=3 Tax=Nostoc TaxID=1177 RepID=A0A9Q5ZDU1_NOSLI|nr:MULTISPECIES: SDR family NAD(P)-dependent oxidoreductase [Nostoc]MBL1200575.1 SDR family NAD(P)-dependent oxidoreductase [Nostoc sp. GBBB01]MDZ8013377.1 SDR family NAD(P)-dependent oxidoreductase [Nostoc sp. ZfuVER08]PHK38142.1 retinol dehydrogenase [Nostoc linckia z15]PHK45545.1 retinol dehydrogenase [Nostoc linckia z16]MBD2615005.1 SDR family NAD(P)-dependent oxidoreductase [Nostoc punctiforme FACHB-252]